MRKIIIITTVLISVSFVYAQDVENRKKLTLDEAIQTALENNISIQISKIQLEQAQRTENHKWNNFLPSVNASVSASDNSGLTSVQNNLSVSAQISANLNLSAGLGKKLQSIKDSYESGLLDYDDSVNQIKVDVTKAFYSLLYTEKQVELNKASLTSYENQYNQIKVKKSQGLVPELDLLTSQLDYENAKVTLKNSQSLYITNYILFLNDIGYPVEDNNFPDLAGDLSDYEKYYDVDFSAWNLDELIENSSSVRSIKDSINQTQLSLDQIKLNIYIPSLTLSANVNPYSFSYSSNPVTKNQTDSWSLSLGFSYSLDNLIPGSAAKDNIASIEDSLNTLNLQLQNTKNQLLTNAIEMINGIELSKETLKNCQQNLELAKKSLELAEVAYKNGTKDLSAFQSAQNTYNNVSVQLNNQQLSLITSIIELKSLLNIND